MKKEKAIRALENQKGKIRGSMKPEIWIDTTSELLNKIFPISGKSKSKHIANIHFYPLLERNPYVIEQQIQKGRLKAEEYIQEFINEINIVGLEKSNDENQIFQLIKYIYLWIILVPLLSGSFFLGNYFGISRFDSEKSSLYEYKQKLNSDLNKANVLIKTQKQIINEKDKIITDLKAISSK